MPESSPELHRFLEENGFVRFVLIDIPDYRNDCLPEVSSWRYIGLAYDAIGTRCVIISYYRSESDSVEAEKEQLRFLSPTLATGQSRLLAALRARGYLDKEGELPCLSA